MTGNLKLSGRLLVPMGQPLSSIIKHHEPISSSSNHISSHYWSGGLTLPILLYRHFNLASHLRDPYNQSWTGLQPWHQVWLINDGYGQCWIHRPECCSNTHSCWSEVIIYHHWAPNKHHHGCFEMLWAYPERKKCMCQTFPTQPFLLEKPCIWMACQLHTFPYWNPSASNRFSWEVANPPAELWTNWLIIWYSYFCLWCSQ